jgi:soluble lytic murein transglycosylase
MFKKSFKQKIFFLLLCGSLSSGATEVADGSKASLAIIEKKINLNLNSIIPEAKKNIDVNLTEVRLQQSQRNWSLCAQKAKIAFNSPNNQELKPWILLNWLRCERRGAASERLSSKRNLSTEPVQALDKNPNWLLSGPWKDLLFSESMKYRLMHQEQLLGRGILSIADANEMLKFKDRLDRDTMAKVWAILAEIETKKLNWSAADNYFELSLNAKESSAIQEKLKAVRLNLRSRSDQALNSINTNIKANTNSNSVLFQDESAKEDRMNVALKQNDLVGFAEMAVEYLNQWPGGIYAKSTFEKLIDIFQTVSDNSRKDPSADKLRTVRSKLAHQISKLESQRQIEIIGRIHRRNDFINSLEMAEVFIKYEDVSMNQAKIYYVAGRSAQFLGEYEKCTQYFSKYENYFSGGEDLPEALFRSALCHWRLSQFSVVAARLEKLLTVSNIDKYEVSARYWFIRALQKTNSPRVQEESKKLIDLQPFSYYGIRIAAEQDNMSFERKDIREESTLKESLFLLPLEQATLNRAKKLAENNWVAEAQVELASLVMPVNPKRQTVWASELEKIGGYSQSIKLLNEAFNESPELRELGFWRIGFPKPFSDKIEEEAKVNGISSFLIRSLIRQESAFNLRATSSSQAMGLMQLIPPTAVEVAQELKIENLVLPDDAFEVSTNVRMGSRYISKMIKQYNNHVPLALAAYNAGPGKMNAYVQLRTETQNLARNFSSKPEDELWFDELPWYETSFYVKAILRNVLIYRLLDEGRVSLDGVFWQSLVKGPEVVSKNNKNLSNKNQLRLPATPRKSTIKR